MVPDESTKVPKKLSVEKHYTVAEIAADWGYSRKIVTRLFADEPGVIKLRASKSDSNNPQAKPRTALRISASARDRVYMRLAAGPPVRNYLRLTPLGRVPKKP